MKVALVELEVAYGREIKLASSPKQATPRAIAARPRERRDQVLLALGAAQDAGANLVIFPLWTLAPHSRLTPLLSHTKGLTAIVGIMGTNALGAGKHAQSSTGSVERVYVLQNGKVLNRESPHIQAFSRGAEIRARWDQDELDEVGFDLHRRLVPVQPKRSAFLLLCGESNALANRHTWNVGAQDLGLDKIKSLKPDIVINPGHTALPIGRMKQKLFGWSDRSKRGVLFHTANLNPRYGQVARASHRTARVVRNDSSEWPEPSFAEGGVRISFHTV